MVQELLCNQKLKAKKKHAALSCMAYSLANCLFPPYPHCNVSPEMGKQNKSKETNEYS